MYICNLRTLLVCIHYVSSSECFSSSLSQSALTTTPESNLLGVMGVSDWDFLRPPSMDSGEDEGKRPSLDDFDGEIAVFQVCGCVWMCGCV